MARLMLSAGMLAALAASVAALRRRLPLGSPPPLLAATVISRRILEKSFPRCTSVLPFFRLICDHRECPDMAPSPSSVDRRFGQHRGVTGFSPLSPHRLPQQGRVPAREVVSPPFFYHAVSVKSSQTARTGPICFALLRHSVASDAPSRLVRL